MSGGSYDYLYSRVRDAASDIERNTLAMQESDGVSVRHPETGEWLVGAQTKELLEPTYQARLWFARLLELVSEAMHDIEWVDSSDYGPSDELQSIQKVAAFLEKAPFLRRNDEPSIVMSHFRSSDTGSFKVPPGYEPFSVHVDRQASMVGVDLYTVFFRKL